MVFFFDGGGICSKRGFDLMFDLMVKQKKGLPFPKVLSLSYTGFEPVTHALKVLSV